MRHKQYDIYVRSGNIYGNNNFVYKRNEIKSPQKKWPKVHHKYTVYSLLNHMSCTVQLALATYPNISSSALMLIQHTYSLITDFGLECNLIEAQIWFNMVGLVGWLLDGGDVDTIHFGSGAVGAQCTN